MCIRVYIHTCEYSSYIQVDGIRLPLYRESLDNLVTAKCFCHNSLVLIGIIHRVLMNFVYYKINMFSFS